MHFWQVLFHLHYYGLWDLGLSVQNFGGNRKHLQPRENQ